MPLEIKLWFNDRIPNNTVKPISDSMAKLNAKMQSQGILAVINCYRHSQVNGSMAEIVDHRTGKLIYKPKLDMLVSIVENVIIAHRADDEQKFITAYKNYASAPRPRHSTTEEIEQFAKRGDDISADRAFALASRDLTTYDGVEVKEYVNLIRYLRNGEDQRNSEAIGNANIELDTDADICHEYISKNCGDINDNNSFTDHANESSINSSWEHFTKRRESFKKK